MRLRMKLLALTKTSQLWIFWLAPCHPYSSCRCVQINHQHMTFSIILTIQSVIEVTFDVVAVTKHQTVTLRSATPKDNTHAVPLITGVETQQITATVTNVSISEIKVKLLCIVYFILSKMKFLEKRL